MNTDQWSNDHRPQPGDSPFTLTVDGEVFTVKMRSGGGEDYTWESGPNDGYGFGGGQARTLGDPHAERYLLTIGEHRESNRGFLSMIDPETGYIGQRTSLSAIRQTGQVGRPILAVTVTECRAVGFSMCCDHRHTDLPAAPRHRRNVLLSV